MFAKTTVTVGKAASSSGGMRRLGGIGSEAAAGGRLPRGGGGRRQRPPLRWFHLAGGSRRWRTRREAAAVPSPLPDPTGGKAAGGCARLAELLGALLLLAELLALPQGRGAHAHIIVIKCSCGGEHGRCIGACAAAELARACQPPLSHLPLARRMRILAPEKKQEEKRIKKRICK